MAGTPYAKRKGMISVYFGNGGKRNVGKKVNSSVLNGSLKT